LAKGAFQETKNGRLPAYYNAAAGRIKRSEKIDEEF
jgi:hypothetical protein